ncbi:MAG: ABC transporter permease subunit [Chlorobi bacterium]|nr:ABC transporter permease subunit [Chlorobiota bacterium]
MKAIFLKEVSAFLSSLIAYIVLAVFFVTSGLWLWVFPQTSILESGYATLQPFFDFAPWLLMFLASAITMRSFAEEQKTQTIELLLTRPFKEWEVVLGKFLASTFLLIVALLPTATYIVFLYWLSTPVGNLPLGAIFGSYMGLILLGASFASIGLFSSVITSSQTVAFLLSLFTSFFLYYGFGAISQIATFIGRYDWFFEQLGMYAHYISLGRGVIDSRDVIYFLSIISAFLFLTQLVLESRK